MKKSNFTYLFVSSSNRPSEVMQASIRKLAANQPLCCREDFFRHLHTRHLKTIKSTKNPGKALETVYQAKSCRKTVKINNFLFKQVVGTRYPRPQGPNTVCQLEQVVLFYLFLSWIMKTCKPSKMLFCWKTCLVLKTFRAFEKHYYRRAFVNFWKSEYFFCRN